MPVSTISDLVNGKSVPTVETLAAYLNLCEITGPAQQPWLEALDRVKNAHLRRPGP